MYTNYKTLELRVDLMQTCLSSELVIPALIKFQQILIPFKDDYPNKWLYDEIEILVAQLRDNRSRIDRKIQLSGFPRTGQVWWPGSRRNFISCR